MKWSFSKTCRFAERAGNRKLNRWVADMVSAIDDPKYVHSKYGSRSNRSEERRRFSGMSAAAQSLCPVILSKVPDREIRKARSRIKYRNQPLAPPAIGRRTHIALFNSSSMESGISEKPMSRSGVSMLFREFVLNQLSITEQLPNGGEAKQKQTKSNI